MQPTQLTPTLEICKRLSEAGVVIDSYFYWVSPYETESWTVNSGEVELWRSVPAPTASEMLALMPPHITLPRKFNDGDWWCMDKRCCDENACCGHESFEEALAETLIWLKGQGYLK